MKQIRVVLFHTGVDSSKAYADQINESLTDEAAVVDIHDPRPVRLALPIRATPNVAVLFFADTLEEGKEIAAVLNQLDYFKRESETRSEVTSLLSQRHFDSHETWLLPSSETLCILRHLESNHGETKEQEESKKEDGG